MSNHVFYIAAVILNSIPTALLFIIIIFLTYTYNIIMVSILHVRLRFTATILYFPSYRPTCTQITMHGTRSSGEEKNRTKFCKVQKFFFRTI